MFPNIKLSISKAYSTSASVMNNSDIKSLVPEKSDTKSNLQKTDNAYTVTISNASKKLAKASFDRNQQNSHTQFKHEQQQEIEGFDRKQQAEEAAFKRKQQVERIAFERKQSIT